MDLLGHSAKIKLFDPIKKKQKQKLEKNKHNLFAQVVFVLCI